MSIPCRLYRILLQLRKDHAGVQTLDQRPFNSIDDALQRLLPYHVFQGAPPSHEEFSQGTPSQIIVSSLNLQEMAENCSPDFYSVVVHQFAEVKLFFYLFTFI